ncbi:alpha-L-fucosidase [Mucilaginibacter sp. X5P1]|uniref:alpha-L-fucosidase n=1 Tax=Mucilaginibacter sp. X5P1 TaxID=2723088 RepID=UPI00160E6506|nr:alpha-L-fucosidase [Mucilaginibacter sp. X5P1]MBB6140818.1 alpha-L-fucosidase [Mucilaginibacter sp. X5P1]
MKYLFCAFILLLPFGNLRAQSRSIDPSIKTSRVVMDNFMDQRFGMFIHWGPVTLRGTEIGWSRGNAVPTQEYDTLYKEFNPVLFNADAWVKTAKDAGMKYLTITAKHHDGFCLWPTKVSNYNIMNSPYKKDIVGELARACKKYDVKFCIYFTVLDWHDPDYPIHMSGSKADTNANMDKFVITMKKELQELVTSYHPYMLWFDGNWESPWKNEYAAGIYTFLKKLDPNVIINNRLGANDAHLKLTAEMIGDFATPEQKIGELNMNTPWETCMTICNQWAWKPNDKMKTLKECIQTLAKTAGGNGNLLFNVGPMPDGRMEARQVERLKEMGEWLKTYGESIYGTKGGPFKPNEIFAATRKGDKLYVHVFEKTANTLTLPVLPNVKVKQAYLLKGGKINYSQGAGGAITLQLPEQLPDSNDSVIVLELTTNAEIIPVVS